MSYASIETSQDSAKQSYLYLVTGVNFQYAFTNTQKTIAATIDGTAYSFTHPRGGISHTEFAESQDSGRTATTLTISIGNPITRKHNQYPPHGNTTLVIYRQNEIDGTPYQIWSGTLFSPHIDGIEASFECLTDFETMARSEGLNDTYQSLCNWFLFQYPCPVNKANWRISGSVVSLDSENFQVVISGAGAYIAGWFTAGYLQTANGDMRSVIADSVSGANHVLTLQQNFPSTTLRAGDSVDAYPGCDRSYATGSTKFGAETGNGKGCGTNNIQTNVNPHEIGRLQ